MPPGLFITGTDTGVGKSVVAALFIASLRLRGVPVAGMKPAETGCAPEPIDARLLIAATGGDDPLDLACPYRFALPVAPEVAARADGTAIDVEVIRRALDGLARSGRFVVVEGAGGAGTPYAPGLRGIDLAAVLGLPVLLVARATLGTVGQTLVTLAAMREARVTCRGIILNRLPGIAPGPDDPTNAPLIEAHSRGVPVLGTMPVVEPPPAEPGRMKAWADRHASILEGAVDLARLTEMPTRSY